MCMCMPRPRSAAWVMRERTHELRRVRRIVRKMLEPAYCKTYELYVEEVTHAHAPCPCPI